MVADTPTSILPGIPRKRKMCSKFVLFVVSTALQIVCSCFLPRAPRSPPHVVKRFHDDSHSAVQWTQTTKRVLVQQHTYICWPKRQLALDCRRGSAKLLTLFRYQRNVLDDTTILRCTCFTPPPLVSCSCSLADGRQVRSVSLETKQICAKALLNLVAEDTLPALIEVK